jgi:hypothetical protein
VKNFAEVKKVKNNMADAGTKKLPPDYFWKLKQTPKVQRKMEQFLVFGKWNSS